MRYSWLSWWFGGVLAVCASMSVPVYASCVGSSTVELLWSYPAEGDSAVPTNAQLQMVFNAELYGSDWDATLNGVPLVRSPDGAFAFGPLAADTDYTFQLEGHQPRSSITTKVVELHFRTGRASADAVQAPVLLGPSSSEQSASTTVCARVDARYYCRDTAPTDVREIMLDESNAVAWIDDAGNVWPRGCFPRVDLIHAQDRCHNMQAVSADGQVSEATEFCPDTGTMVLGQSRTAAPSDSCAVASVGRASSRGPLPLLVLLLGCMLRRCRRRRDTARYSPLAANEVSCAGPGVFVALLTCMTTRAFKILIPAALGIALGSGCGDCLERDTGESVLTSCVSRVELQQAGSGFPQPPDGSTCSGQEHYVVDLQESRITWTKCVGGSLDRAWTTSSGQRALTPDELAAFIAELDDVTVSGEEGRCGADKPTRTIRLFGDDAELTYNDSFYHCRYPAPHVDRIDSAFSVASQLTAR